MNYIKIISILIIKALFPHFTILILIKLTRLEIIFINIFILLIRPVDQAYNHSLRLIVFGAKHNLVGKFEISKLALDVSPHEEK